MRWKQHIIGTLIAAVGAVLLLVLVNFAMPSQMVLNERVVIQASKEAVFPFVSNPDSMALWYDDIKGYSFSQKPGSHRYQFLGKDNQMHELKILGEKSDGKVKIEYYQADEKKAVFFFELLSNGDETIVKVEQFWNVGWNPLAKLMANGREEEMVKLLKRDLIELKKRFN
jgi:uncharacterized protein YndB with AHSA1/START domain